MNWKKCGKIFCANNDKGWMKSRAYLPTPFLINSEVIRIYFTALDEKNMGRVGYVDVEAHNPSKIVRVSQDPVLDIGNVGSFDDSGVNASCIIRHNNELIMYYQGWQHLNRVPYNVLSNAAISYDNGDSFQRYKSTPMLERKENEMNIRSAPFVLFDNSLWKLWYANGFFINGEDNKSLYYGISHISSYSPLEFISASVKCLFPNHKADTFGYTRPWIIIRNNLYLIWFSERSYSKKYRINFATSLDGITWQRKSDPIHPDISPEKWDSDMIAFPAVIETNYGVYMFYNGNHYGLTGFGFAKLEGSIDELTNLGSIE